jgi:hypothetical protein
MLQAVSSKTDGSGIFCDIPNHGILMTKLVYCGMDEMLLKWSSSSFTNIKQKLG